MKYYLYISEIKINMLLSQIPKKLWERYKAEISIDLELISATISKNDSDSTVYSKIKIIEKYLEKEVGIGTIDNPQNYFNGVSNVNWGEWNENSNSNNPIVGINASDVVFFKGETDKSKFILVGSSRHMIGNIEAKPVHSRYVSPYFLSKLAESIKEPLKNEDSEAGFREMHSLLFSDDKQKISFLAKKLLSKDKILIGSPIYVCLEE